MGNLKTILYILFFGCCGTAIAQGEFHQGYSFFDGVNLGLGYNYNFDEPNQRNFHVISVDLNKTTFGGHASGFQYGAGTEIGINTYNFVLGPKINGMLIYQGISRSIQSWNAAAC